MEVNVELVSQEYTIFFLFFIFKQFCFAGIRMSAYGNGPFKE